jgi:DNA-binding NarL/FixJ family response regulator
VESGTPLVARIVEDDELIRELLRSVFLAAEGIHITGIHGSVEDILHASAECDPPDVVIMDINLPGMSGIEGVHALRERWPRTQYLMYTVNDTDELVYEALRAGANGYLLKNASPARIMEAVFDIHQGGAPMSMTVARRVIKHFRPPQPSALKAEADLNDREMTLLEGLAQGLLYKEMAARLGVGEGTVKQYIHRIYKKLHVSNRTEAVNRYFDR